MIPFFLLSTAFAGQVHIQPSLQPVRRLVKTEQRERHVGAAGSSAFDKLWFSAYQSMVLSMEKAAPHTQLKLDYHQQKQQIELTADGAVQATKLAFFDAENNRVASYQLEFGQQYGWQSQRINLPKQSFQSILIESSYGAEGEYTDHNRIMFVG